MRQLSLFCVHWILALVCAHASARVVIDMVDVGNPGNVADSTGHGAVNYAYQIGRTEVTNSQYVEFLNAVAATDTNLLYSPFMGSNVRGGITQLETTGSFTYAVKENMSNKPVNYVSFEDAMRFANWLHNGQPTGLQNASTTETGAYTITGSLPAETREPGAQFVIPTLDEWYKAAYHKNDGATGNYFKYSTSSDTLPTGATADVDGNVSNPGSNVANFGNSADWNSRDGNVTTVASAGATSPYLTFDQAGNVGEWTELPIESSNLRAIPGGGFNNFAGSLVATTIPAGTVQGTQGANLGFRIASVPAPAPRVEEVLVGSTQWSNGFRTIFSGNDGFYSMPSDARQLDPAPWIVDQVRIVFSEDVVVSEGDLAINGNLGPKNVIDFEDSTDGTATWTFDAISVDSLVLTLSDDVASVATGLSLDGDYATGGLLPSGNGTPGGDFVFSLNVLAGDADQSGVTSLNDLQILATNWRKVTSMDNMFADFDGSGDLTLNDLQILATNWQQGSMSTVTAVPEPSNFVQLALALCGLSWRGRSARDSRG